MTILKPDVLVTGAWVRIEGELIAEIGTGSAPVGEVVALDGALLPGFVDIHCHGGGGHSFDDVSEVIAGADFHLNHGTTTLIASLVSDSVANQCDRLQYLAELVRAGVIAGVHLEGPFLASSKCGAQNPAVLVAPTAIAVEQLLAAAQGCLRQITIAPELPGAIEAIEEFTQAGVRVAIGHSAADATAASAAVDAGASLVTHLFNAMHPVHHREASLANVALADPRLAVEVIADGVHVSDSALQLAANAKGSALIAITDAISAAGMPDGDYELGGLSVSVADSVARLAGTQTLAGSTLTMDRAFSHLVDQVGLDLVAAAHACASAPAAAIGLGDVGAIEVGRKADFVLWHNGLRQVWRAGRLAS